ncbi:MAG TPA: molecular chaperone DnaJ [Acidimicrobiales bacterium]|nr:molecular chaperone DnaJ [Acidimicrobiales bacterium]
MDDFYALLGVSRQASADEIKRAYRQLARELHPDANPDDAEAHERFKEITAAYETLSDPERRQRYDTFGAAGARGSGPDAGAFFGGGGLGDIFEAFFGDATAGRRGPSGPPRGADAEAVLDLAFEEAVFGAERELTLRLPVTCGTCAGSGAAEGSKPITCEECGGSGEVRRVRQSILGQMVTSGPCGRCGGNGSIVDRPCADCRGDGRRTEERVEAVTVPAGVAHGQTLRSSGRGAAGSRGGQPGDLYLHVRVRPHDRFERDGVDLHAELRVSFTQAALGTHVDFETLDGSEEVAVAPGTQTGAIVRLRGRGVPHVGGRSRGDLHVHIVVETPTKLTPAQEELLRTLAKERNEPVDDASAAGLLGRIRSAFS